MKRGGWLVLLAMSACTVPAAQQVAQQVAEHVSGLPQHDLVNVAAVPTSGTPRNVILVIGDGMGPAQVHAAATANGGHLDFERFPVIGQSRTASSSDWVTDSAAAATAMATGTKTHNGAIGVGPDDGPLTNLVEIAEARGKSTGVVVTCSLTHATPAAFVAHQPDRTEDEAIALSYPPSGVDVAFGGGWKYFAERSDGRDLVAEWTAKGTTVARSFDALPAEGPVVVMAAEEHLGRAVERGETWLGDAATEAVRRLDADPDGFFLMVEGSQIDWGGHENDAYYMASEALDLDRAVGRLLEWAAADGETLIVVTADHETGGFAILEGDPAKGEFTGRFHTMNHTAVPVTVYAFGPGADRFEGVYENTGVFDRILGLWDAAAPSAADTILTSP